MKKRAWKIIGFREKQTKKLENNKVEQNQQITFMLIKSKSNYKNGLKFKLFQRETKRNNGKKIWRKEK